MRKMFVGVILILTSIALFGCSTTVFRKPVTISTKSNIGKYVQATDKKVSFSKSQASCLLIPILSLTPKKINEGFLKELNNGTAVDVQFYNTKVYWYFPIWVSTKLTIEGNLVEIKK